MITRVISFALALTVAPTIAICQFELTREVGPVSESPATTTCVDQSGSITSQENERFSTNSSLVILEGYTSDLGTETKYSSVTTADGNQYTWQAKSTIDATTRLSINFNKADRLHVSFVAVVKSKDSQQTSSTCGEESSTSFPEPEIQVLRFLKIFDREAEGKPTFTSEQEEAIKQAVIEQVQNFPALTSSEHISKTVAQLPHGCNSCLEQAIDELE